MSFEQIGEAGVNQLSRGSHYSNLASMSNKGAFEEGESNTSPGPDPINKNPA